MRYNRFNMFINNKNGSFFSNMNAGEAAIIKQVAEKYKIRRYDIDQDGKLIVYGDVVFKNESFKRLPIDFKKVSGNFICHNSLLETLEGAPEIVERDFSIEKSKNIKNLKYGPRIVFGSYSISDCTNLESIEGIAEKIGVALYAENIGFSLTISDINKLATIKHNNIHI